MPAKSPAARLQERTDAPILLIVLPTSTLVILREAEDLLFVFAQPLTTCYKRGMEKFVRKYSNFAEMKAD